MKNIVGSTAAIAVLIAGILLCLVARAQTVSPGDKLPAVVEHAPPLEQCRADVRLWHSQTKDDVSKLSFDELQQRSLEMWNCPSTDVGAGEGIKQYEIDMDNYRAMHLVYQGLSGQRMLDYIVRHGETNQFLDEDAKGLR